MTKRFTDNGSILYLFYSIEKINTLNAFLKIFKKFKCGGLFLSIQQKRKFLISQISPEMFYIEHCAT